MPTRRNGSRARKRKSIFVTGNRYAAVNHEGCEDASRSQGKTEYSICPY